MPDSKSLIKVLKYQSESDNVLFGEWLRLSSRIMRLAGLIQNDMEVSTADLKEFIESTSETRKDLTDLAKRTVEWVRNHERK